MSIRIASTTHRAVIFDLDGVVTDTASVHAAAWKRLFDDYLERSARRTGQVLRPFSLDDYRRTVDGKPRYDGVDAFLRSRGMKVPWGEPGDGPEKETVYGLGNRKDRYFEQRLEEDGVEVFADAVALLGRLRDVGVATAIVSASRNCRRVLQKADLERLFDVRVDGVVADALNLSGKPDPATFLEAARRLDVKPDRAVVIEDALVGMEAGRRGGFGVVIGVDRDGTRAGDLARAGADAVVSTLDDVEVRGPVSDPVR